MMSVVPKRSFDRMIDDEPNEVNNLDVAPTRANWKKIRTQEKLVELQHQFIKETPFKITTPFVIGK